MAERERIRKKEVKEVRLNTTLQETKIISPTDRKLTEKVIEYYRRVTKKVDIRLICPYSRETKKFKHQLRFTGNAMNMKSHWKEQARLH